VNPATVFLIFVFLDQLIIPGFLILWMGKKQYKSKIDWIFQSVFTDLPPLFVLPFKVRVYVPQTTSHQ